MFISYYLRKDGHSVTLIDAPLDGARTSKYNSGEITPSGVPVPSIGMSSYSIEISRANGPRLCIALCLFEKSTMVWNRS